MWRAQGVDARRWRKSSERHSSGIIVAVSEPLGANHGTEPANISTQFVRNRSTTIVGLKILHYSVAV